MQAMGLEELLATVKRGCEERDQGLTFTRGFSLLTSQDGLALENFSHKKVKLPRTSRFVDLLTIRV